MKRSRSCGLRPRLRQEPSIAQIGESNYIIYVEYVRNNATLLYLEDWQDSVMV